MSGGSSLYLPLPQSNTDSDSEEELHSGPENRVKNRPKPRIDVRIDPGVTKLNYKQLDEDRDLSTTLNGFASAATTVTIVKPPSTTVPALSTTRKALFIFSLLVCLMTIVGFLWILPCDLNPCPPASLPQGAKSWETPILDFELHGPVAVVPRAKGPGGNLVFLARRAVSAPQPLRHELLCLLGASGDVAWTHMLTREPLDLDCSMLDANKDGVLDCIVAGGEDLLKAIDPLSGMKVWEVPPTSNSSRPYRTQFPLILPDLNKDGVPDLLTARSFRGASSHSHLLLVSGASGQVIGEPVPSAFCAAVSGLVLEKDFSVSYTCIDTHNKKSEQTMELVELVDRAVKRRPTAWAADDARDLPRSHDVAPGASLEAHVAGRRLLLENQGRCPNDCRVIVVVKDRNNQTLYNRSSEGVYGMAPVTLSFDRLTGFVLKFWQWHGRKGKRTSNSTDQLPATGTPDLTFGQASFINGFRRSRRRSVDGLWVEVSERVVLITFNETDHHVMNVSQQTVVQLCHGPSCQPSAPASRRSLLIADLDGDGSKELVSYTSSYVSIGDADPPVQRRLQTRVRVVRLEAELPQLYDALFHL